MRRRWRQRLRGWKGVRWGLKAEAAWLYLALLGAWRADAGEPLAWQASAGYRSAPIPVPSSGRSGFTELPPAVTGITFTNTLSRTNAALNQILMNGSGVAAGDVDGDGWCDLYFCGLETGNVLYRNRGNWRFEDVTAEAGVACAGQQSTGAVFADVDADGDLDLLVNSVGGGTRLFLNDGQGHFAESSDSGLTRRFGAMSLALADIDGNGTLDLFVANYRTTTIRSTGFELLNVNGRRMLRPEDRDRLYVTPDGFLREYGEVSFLYLNDGKGHFQPVSWTDGRFRDPQGQPLKVPPRDWTLSAMFRDLNGDGAPDLYLCNDFWSPDRVWINDGHGRFQEIAREALPCTSTFSMAIDFADINRDGFDDFFVLDMFSPDHVRRLTQTLMFGLTPWPLGYPAARPQVTRNTLFLNRGDGTFTEIAQQSGVHATDWSWSALFLDVDLDGYEDILVNTGNTFDTQDQDAEARIRAKGPWPKAQVPYKLWLYPPLQLPRVAYRNRGDLTFEEVGESWGFHTTGVAQGICLADLDNDGDLDVVVNALNAGAGIYRSESPRPRVAVRLKGEGGNPRGVGARILLRGGAVALQSQEIIGGGRYLSGDDSLRVFATGALTNRLQLEVRWRGGKRSLIDGIQANRVYEIDEAAAAVPQPVPKADPTPWFEDVSAQLAHTHHQEPFDDFARQPLLANKLSQLGPSVAWFDLDGDGWEDLIVGGGQGGTMGAWRNDGRGGFTRLSQPPFDRTLERDQAAVLGGSPAEGRTVLFAGASNYRDASAEAVSVERFEWATGTAGEGLPGQAASTGPLALADVDGDGALDLFVGGRVIPGRYPEPASSRLFRSRDGQFTLDADNSQVLAKVGLVSGAVFTDLDGDGLPELVLACEWGPVRVFQNRRGRLEEATAAWGLDRYAGWWNGVTAGDFDGDGRLDLVAANWGRNTPYESHRAQPLRLYYGDFNQAGGVEAVEAYFDTTYGKLMPERPFEGMAVGLPFLRERFATHRSFAEASLQEILGDTLKSAHELTANTLESMVFLNRGARFEARALPVEAQMAPAFGVAVGDADGDGREDVFLSQNFFATQPLTSPYNAGRGLWLRGDGQGGFTSVPGQASGVAIYGEQRGCALADYDHDGRVDLVVGQNAGPTRLFRNRAARPGLCVRLVGPPGNPLAIGAVVRVETAGKAGPAREIHAGAGYWSQDAATQVLAVPAGAVTVRVRWPGGRESSQGVPAGARELVAKWPAAGRP